MARFDDMKGIFGLLPTPYKDDLEIHTVDLKKVANFCCESGQHGIVWPVMVGEFWFLGEEERIRGLDVVLDEVNGRLPVVFGCQRTPPITEHTLALLSRKKTLTSLAKTCG